MEMRVVAFATGRQDEVDLTKIVLRLTARELRDDV